jgi:hypothetical protein
MHPALLDEVRRLYELEAAHAELVDEARGLRRQVERSAVMLGETKAQLQVALNRLAELCPPEIVKARRDAYMTGAGFFRVVSLGRHRYATEHIPPGQVTVRSDDQ